MNVCQTVNSSLNTRFRWFIMQIVGRQRRGPDGFPHGYSNCHCRNNVHAGQHFGSAAFGPDTYADTQTTT